MQIRSLGPTQLGAFLRLASCVLLSLVPAFAVQPTRVRVSFFPVPFLLAEVGVRKADNGSVWVWVLLG